VSLNNLGMIALLKHDYATTVIRCTEARRITDQVGDTWLAAIADNNLGNASRELGELDAALEHYGDALRAYTTLGDPWALAILYDDIAIMAARRGESEAAIVLAAAAESLHDELGTPRIPSVVAEIDLALEPARRALGPAAATATATGSRLGAAGANTLAGTICGL
jgi:tetratricopeptide (TPR) repeat protein